MLYTGSFVIIRFCVCILQYSNTTKLMSFDRLAVTMYYKLLLQLTQVFPELYSPKRAGSMGILFHYQILIYRLPQMKRTGKSLHIKGQLELHKTRAS